MRHTPKNTNHVLCCSLKRWSPSKLCRDESVSLTRESFAFGQADLQWSLSNQEFLHELYTWLAYQIKGGNKSFTVPTMRNEINNFLLRNKNLLFKNEELVFVNFEILFSLERTIRVDTGIIQKMPLVKNKVNIEKIDAKNNRNFS